MFQIRFLPFHSISQLKECGLYNLAIEKATQNYQTDEDVEDVIINHMEPLTLENLSIAFRVLIYGMIASIFVLMMEWTYYLFGDMILRQIESLYKKFK